MNVTPSKSAPPPSPPPAAPRLSKTAFIGYFALLTILSVSVPFLSIPLFAVTVITLAATGRLKSTVNTVKEIAKETFGHKSELQMAVDTFHATLLRDFSATNAPTVTVNKAELEANFKYVRAANLVGPMWPIFLKDANRGVAYEITGKPSAIRAPESAFADIVAFCGWDTDKAQTLTLLIHQGEFRPMIEQFLANGMRIVDKSGYFVKLKKVEDKIQIQLWVATSVGNFQDPSNANSTPKPIWACVQLTVSEADLATKTFESSERKVFYLPRADWLIDSERDETRKIEASEALRLLNAQIREQHLKL